MSTSSRREQGGFAGPPCTADGVRDVARTVTLAVLAGGRGTRMGMRKDRVSLDGRGLVEHVLGRLAWPGPTMLVGPAGEDRVAGAEFCDVAVRDADADHGPLRAVLTAAEASGTGEMVVIPLDMPGLDGAMLRTLVARGLDDASAPCVMFERDGEIEPLPLLVRRSARAALRALLAAGERSVRSMATLPGAMACAGAGPECAWANLNRPQDVRTFERTMRRVHETAAAREHDSAAPHQE